MKSVFVHISLFVCAVSFLAGCGKSGSLIPPGVMSDIYYDMFLADQWLKNNPDMKEKADSMLVYEPIFNRYGYTTADYDVSVTYYLARPEQYLKIAQKTADLFNDDLDEIDKLKMEIKDVERKNLIFSHYISKDFSEDSVRWSFGLMKEKIDSILIENKWIISQENTDSLRMTSSIAQ